MSNFIANVDVSASAYASLASGFSTVQVVNTSTYPILLGVADTAGNIAGTIPLAPGDAYPFANVPAGAQVWAKIAQTIKTTTKGATGKDPSTNTNKTLAGKVAVYKPS